MHRALSVAAVAALALSVAMPAPAQDEDPIFGFIPGGGRTILAGLLDAGAPDAVVSQMLETDRDAEAWAEWIGDNRDAVPGLSGLDEWQAMTLAAYLHNTAPVPAAGLAGEDLRRAMPRDGRDLIMRYCQSCHIITVTVTQERTREAWLGTLNNPSHVEIAIDARERREMADYLVLNAGIPIDLIPPPLRAGGASY
ncbi:MAG: hypothetical protein ACK4KW_13845 [Gemmobacter sp.]